MAAPVEYKAVGRRKTSVARVYMRPGAGKITVNHRPFEEYFPLAWNQLILKRPLAVTNTDNQFDIVVTARGGGISGQAEATQLGIARALIQFDEDFRKSLKAEDLLTRDPRMVERKKYGQPKARKRFQFSKR